MYKIVVSLLLTLLGAHFLFAQAVSVNTTGAPPDSSAILDVASTAKGVLIPRMTTAQRTSITSPATGLLVFDETTLSFWLNDGSNWVELKSGNISELSDADDDTKVQVEKNPDEDIIRFDLLGEEKMVLTQGAGGASRLEFPGNNVALGNEAGENMIDGMGGGNNYFGFHAGYGNQTGDEYG